MTGRRANDGASVMVELAYGSFLENGALPADAPTERVLPDFGFALGADAFLAVASGLGAFAARPHASTVVGLAHVRRWAVQRGRRSGRCARRGQRRGRRARRRRGRWRRRRFEDDVGRFGTPDRRTIGTFHLAATSGKKQCDGRSEEDGWAHDSPIAGAMPPSHCLPFGWFDGPAGEKAASNATRSEGLARSGTRKVVFIHTRTYRREGS